ncbi:hypothetical protein SUDANB105_00811 [Streptomyces sp. enrichment culture]
MELLTCSPVEYSVIRRWRGSHCFAYSATVFCPSSLRASATDGAVRFFSAYICVRRSIASSCVSNPPSSTCFPRPLRKRIVYGCGHRVGLAQPQSLKNEPIPRAR